MNERKEIRVEEQHVQSREMCKSERLMSASGLWQWKWKWKGNGKYESLGRKTQQDFPLEDSMSTFPAFLVKSGHFETHRTGSANQVLLSYILFHPM